MITLLAQLLQEGYTVYLEPVPDEDFGIQATVLHHGITEAKVWGRDLGDVIERAYLDTQSRYQEDP